VARERTPGGRRGRRATTAAPLIGLLLAAAFWAVPGAGAGPELAGCEVFPAPPASLPADAPSQPNQTAWNQDISQAPVAPGSARTIAYINAHGDGFLHPDFGSPREYGIPFTVVGPGTRRVPIRYTAYGEESDRGPFPIPRGAPVEGGRLSDGDRHVIVVERGACRLYELYRAFPAGKGRGAHWKADSGVAWDLGSAGLRREGWTSADAAGLPIFPGLLRYGEVESNRLRHAIRVTFESTRDAWIRPATHCAGDTANPAAPAMGTRLRLKPGYGLGRLRGQAKVIATALKRYGLIVADNGSNWFFSGATDPRWDDESLDQLKTIPGSAFQVVRSAAGAHPC
jgi:hypothetical protein